jgi:dihydrofolate reductase
VTDESCRRHPFYRHRRRKEHDDDQGLHRGQHVAGRLHLRPAETGFEHLFKWYGNGEVEVPTAQPEMTLRMTPESAAHFRGLVDNTGALVVGRKLFDSTSAWGGRHPMDRPVVVVTHSVPEGWPRDDAPFTFVTDGIERAVEQAKALAGDRVVGVNGGTIASQCLNAGLLDEVWVDLVPVLLGGGTPFFDQLKAAPVELEGPVSVVQGSDVTHLRYRVRHR